MASKYLMVLGAALLAASPAAAATPAADNTTTYTTTEQRDEGRFPWGLLGLLGLAGLIPRKRHVNVEVDNRTHR
jgi:MYXO-CTERM domain-containing protein